MNLLLIEDSPTDAYIVREALQRVAGVRFAVRHVDRMGDAILAIEAGDFDVVLLDLGLPDSEDTAGVSKLHRLYPGLPLVVLTGLDDEAAAMRALHAGADDYLVKGEVEPKVLARMLRYAVERRQMARDRLELEARLHEAQRRESLVALAGGVAHHFNNLLAIILGYTETLQTSGALSESQRHDLGQIEAAARRAAGVSQQMATFTGSGLHRTRPTGLGDLVRRAEPMLREIVAPPARLSLELDAPAPPVQASEQGLRQVLENLARNAVEALPGGEGGVAVRVGHAELDEAAIAGLAKNEPLAPGLYAVLEVRDTGVGLGAEARGRMFDPFYSSKFTGRGMGLAVTLGIVGMHRGGIGVESAPGAGATLRVYLPASDEAA